jgi:hypothetical protein
MVESVSKLVIYEASANIESCTFDWTISPQITDLRQACVKSDCIFLAIAPGARAELSAAESS